MKADKKPSYSSWVLNRIKKEDKYFVDESYLLQIVKGSGQNDLQKSVIIDSKKKLVLPKITQTKKAWESIDK